jgi:hypothetical protein
MNRSVPRQHADLAFAAGGCLCLGEAFRAYQATPGPATLEAVLKAQRELVHFARTVAEIFDAGTADTVEAPAPATSSPGGAS